VRSNGSRIVDLEEIKRRDDRKAIFNAVDKLCRLGTELAPPHVKPLKGEVDLCELRPRQGRSAVRPLYRRFGDLLVILAIARKSDFRAEWQRLALAREIAAELVRYRSENDLSQRGLADRLSVSQPRVAKQESGEHNPDVDTLVSLARATGLEFVIDIAPAQHTPTLVTKKVRDKRPTLVEDDVSVIAAVT
jgi:transcriptional regulator with XRE-family HTH domain